MTILAALAALAPILGALAGLVPALLQYKTMRANNERDIELKRLELQAAEKGYTFQLDLAAANADIHQQDHIYNFANQPSGYRWVDAFTVIMRPYITFVVFNFWWLLKVAVFIAAVNAALTLQQIIPLVWTDADAGMLGSVVGFWFGNRSGSRAMAAAAATPAAPPPAAKPSVVQKIIQKIIPDPPGSRP